MEWSDRFIYFNGVLLRRRNLKIVGTMHAQGYVQTSIKGRFYLVHRIIWEMHNGKIPEGMEIDHINHDRSDNRIENLRLVTGCENKKNQSIRKRNKSGFTGVSWHSKAKKWRAEIKSNGVYRYLGLYSSIDDAINARKEAEKEFMFHENHGK